MESLSGQLSQLQKQVLPLAACQWIVNHQVDFSDPRQSSGENVTGRPLCLLSESAVGKRGQDAGA